MSIQRWQESGPALLRHRVISFFLYLRTYLFGCLFLGKGGNGGGRGAERPQKGSDGD